MEYIRGEVLKRRRSGLDGASRNTEIKYLYDIGVGHEVLTSSWLSLQFNNYQFTRVSHL